MYDETWKERKKTDDNLIRKYATFMVFCFENCSDLMREKEMFKGSKKSLRLYKSFEISWKIYLSNDSSEKKIVTGGSNQI